MAKRGRSETEALLWVGSIVFDIFYFEGIRNSCPGKSALVIHKQENFSRISKNVQMRAVPCGAHDDSMLQLSTMLVATKN